MKRAPPFSSLGSIPWADAALSDWDFGALSTFIHEHCGIRYTPAKKLTLEGRVRKRLRALGLASFDEYCPRVIGPAASAEEIVRLIDEVTTNKTDFFREPTHFDYLKAHALPELAAENGAGIDRDLVVWSAACSTGEEIYTLAMVLDDQARVGKPLRFSLLGTDISTEVLTTARRAVYSEKLIEPVPAALRARYLLQSKDRDSGLIRIAPALRARTRFARLNLLEPFTLSAAPDVIFCRNVLIYFDRPTQRRVLDRLSHSLKPGGFLFLGHSDSLAGLELPLVQMKPSIYRKPLSGK